MLLRNLINSVDKIFDSIVGETWGNFCKRAFPHTKWRIAETTDGTGSPVFYVQYNYEGKWENYITPLGTRKPLLFSTKEKAETYINNQIKFHLKDLVDYESSKYTEYNPKVWGYYEKFIFTPFFHCFFCYDWRT